MARALQVLDAFLDSNGSLSLAEVSARTGLYKSTIGRILRTLELHDYVVRTAHGAFHVGPALLRLATRYQEATRPAATVLPALRTLARRTGENASFVVPLGQERIVLHRVHSSQALRDHGLAGDVVPLERGAAGHVFRAWRAPERDVAGDNGAVMLFRSEGEIEAGMSGLACPIFDDGGSCVAVVALTGPASRFTARARRAFAPHLLAAARALTRREGGDVRRFAAALADARGGATA